MITEFDKLVEQYLTELMPAELGIGAPAMAKKIVKKASEAPMSGHWKAIKRLPNMEDAVLEIMQTVFPEKHPETGKEFSYSSVIDNKEDLKNEIFNAIQKITQKKGYAEQFARDRVTTATLEEVVFELADEVMKKNQPVTQKEVKQALNKALEQKPAAEVENEATYYRAADIDSDDTALTKAFNKIPAEGNIKWSEIVSKVGEEAAIALKKAGALIEVVGAEEEEPEQKEGEGTGEVTKGIENDDVEDFDNFDDVYSAIDSSFRTTKGDYYRD